MVKTYLPHTWQEALFIRGNDDTMLLAGGTDLMVKYHGSPGITGNFPKPLLFLNQISSLKTINIEKDSITIGSNVTLNEAAAISALPLILKQALGEMASPAIRNAGTLIGNICNASPAGDTLPPLYVLNARLTIESLSSTRQVALADFIQGPGKIDLKANEIVRCLTIPRPNNTICFYKKVGMRKASAISKLSFAAIAQKTDQKITYIAAALGAVGPTIIRSKEAENLLTGKTEILTDTWETMHTIYNSLLCPIDDKRSSAIYRKTIALNLLTYFYKEYIWQ